MAPNVRSKVAAKDGGKECIKTVEKDGGPTIFPRKSPMNTSKSSVTLPVYPSKSAGRRNCSSSQNCSADSKKKVEQEHTVPWVTALTTYFGYALVIVFGYMRDTMQNINNFFNPVVSPDKPPEGYASLLNDFQHFYTRRLYHRVQDCFNRPICSAPGAWIDVVKRERTTGHDTMITLNEHITALNLSSYNYLGFGECDREMKDEVISAMRTYGVANCCARSDIGTTELHKELESYLARFIGKEAAIVFGMGFATNSMVLPALVDKGCLIISDELNHSSIVTGARGSGAKIKVFKHNSALHLEQILRSSIVEGQPRSHRPWSKILVVVEGLYSMEGEICKLREIVDVCKKYRAYVYVDEAHSIGALGSTGRGVLEHTGVSPDEVDIMMGTFTKSFGSVGGYIAGSAELIGMLRRSCPSSVNACSMAPACAMQVILALKMIMGEDGSTKGRDKIQQLKRNANLFRSGLERMGCEVLGDIDSPVVPVMLYNPAKIPAFSRECLDRNLAVVVVGFPATPLIKARVRFCISAAHTEKDLIDALTIVDDIADKVMIKYKWSGKPNVMAQADLMNQNKELMMNVVGEWDATHFGWKDTLRINPDGRFARGNGDEGSWHVRAEDGKLILDLEWDRWEPERLVLQAPKDDKCPSPRRHIFKGQANIIGDMPLHSTFTLRPKQGSGVDTYKFECTTRS